jgi:biopolymer transport protein ExbD
MAEIIESDSGAHKQGGRRTPRKMGASVDMTPMVDLMCLLITFFMLTTAFSKPKVMDITMPEKDNNTGPTPQVRADLTYSILLGGNDKVYWYWHKDVPEKEQPTLAVLHKTKYGAEGIRKFLLEKNDITVKEINELKAKVKAGNIIISNDSLNSRIKAIKKHWSTANKSPIILIKADEKALYRNLVDIIDEMAITNIAGYAVVDLSAEEKQLLQSAP